MEKNIILDNSKILELSSNLAHNRALDETTNERRNENFSIFIDENAEELIYTEEFQNIFNKWYDYFYNEIIKFK